MIRALQFLVCLLLLSTTGLAAQQVDAPVGEPGSELTIYLMTIGPGEAVWERFGHNGIVVADKRTGFAAMYDWGRFSFDQPGYVPRLMKGLMMYWMDGADAQATINYYSKSNRSVQMQELNLTPAQRLEMAQFLEWNSQEQNKYYQYDYYRDNCSTRVRDAMDRVIGGRVAATLKPIQTEETYRSHTRRLNYFDIPTYTGLQLAMGNPIDRPLTAWEEAFLPEELMKWVRQVKVRDASGRELPLVAREVTVFQAQRPALAEHAPDRIVWYLVTGLAIAGLVLLLGWRRPWTGARKIGLLIVVGLWSIVGGIFGLLIALLWAFTNHTVTYYNENIVQASLIQLPLAVFAIGAIARGWAMKTAARLSLLIAGMSFLGFIFQIFPGFDQVNGEIIALMMPVHMAIAYVLSSPRKTVTA
jgi:hypothetical protein